MWNYFQHLPRTESRATVTVRIRLKNHPTFEGPRCLSYVVFSFFIACFFTIFLLFFYYFFIDDIDTQTQQCLPSSNKTHTVKIQFSFILFTNKAKTSPIFSSIKVAITISTFMSIEEAEIAVASISERQRCLTNPTSPTIFQVIMPLPATTKSKSHKINIFTASFKCFSVIETKFHIFHQHGSHHETQLSTSPAIHKSNYIFSLLALLRDYQNGLGYCCLHVKCVIIKGEEKCCLCLLQNISCQQH